MAVLTAGEMHSVIERAKGELRERLANLDAKKHVDSPTETYSLIKDSGPEFVALASDSKQGSECHAAGKSPPSTVVHHTLDNPDTLNSKKAINDHANAKPGQSGGNTNETKLEAVSSLSFVQFGRSSSNSATAVVSAATTSEKVLNATERSKVGEPEGPQVSTSTTSQTRIVVTSGLKLREDDRKTRPKGRGRSHSQDRERNWPSLSRTTLEETEHGGITSSTRNSSDTSDRTKKKNGRDHDGDHHKHSSPRKRNRVERRFSNARPHTSTRHVPREYRHADKEEFKEFRLSVRCATTCLLLSRTCRCSGRQHHCDILLLW